MSSTNKGPAKKPAEKDNDPAVNLIRQKVDGLYDNEPNAREEANEVAADSGMLSKHQAYMKEISNSGMSLAEIQTAWHNYYVALPDNEKHEVWKEFYAEHDKRQKEAATPQPTSQVTGETKPEAKPAAKLVSHNTAAAQRRRTKIAPKVQAGARTVSEVKKQLTNKAALSAQSKLKAKQHFQSVLFGVGMGLLVVLILLFGFFNERFIAPFITPSKNVSNTPIIIDDSTGVAKEPQIVIPKINVEIPVVYDEPSIEEQAIQNALERGVVHYATTPDPGQLGNAVIFGHSSNNILNKGKYKFAFVLLNRLEVGDVFYLSKNGTRYAYKIYDKKIVDPTDVGVLGSNDKKATVTLITCDPPGTTLHRLIVVGEQISPDPGKNTASTAKAADTKATIIPSNAPSLWQRIKDWF
jgi:sortase A